MVERTKPVHTPARTKARTMGVIHGLVTGFLVSCSLAQATECITPESHARRYHQADVVIFGQVISCTTNVVERKDVPGDSGWVNHYTTHASTCTVRVDSVLKGALAESVMVIQKEWSRAWMSRSEPIDENGESPCVGQIAMAAVSPGPGEANEIPSSGRWILFLMEDDSTYTFLWRADYNRMNLDLYGKLAEEGEDIFEKYDF